MSCCNISVLADSRLEKRIIISHWAFWLEGERWSHHLAAFCDLVPAGSSSEGSQRDLKAGLVH